MLNFYDHLEDIPHNIQIIKSNDAFFNAFSIISDDEFSTTVLKHIDKAIRVSDFTFIGRNPEFGSLFKNFLSTGAKTLLNIKQHPDLCFNIIECGVNALELLPFIREGYVYSLDYVDIYTNDLNKHCNILYRGDIYTNLSNFIRVYSNNYDEDYSDEL